MRYPAEHKESVRAKIVEAASRMLRREGVTGVSIPTIMKKAGLTHGGFYSHFRDRDELVSEAVAFAAGETGPGLFDEGRGSLTDTLDHYLSREHVSRPGEGCVLAALGTEAARQPAPVRQAFARAARGFLQGVQRRRHPGSPAGRLSEDTLALAAAMIGAVVLARLVQDEALAGRILDAVRRAGSR